ncbi:hypothetical protein ACLESD_33165 [Pyxidicoccus sp. 3LFB2]
MSSRDEEGTMTTAAHAPVRAPGLRVIRGEGQRREEPLACRNAVARVLMEAGADLLLRRISPARAAEIERKVDRVLDLFDRVDVAPVLMPVLKRHLDELEAADAGDPRGAGGPPVGRGVLPLRKTDV